jgi:hypothetical protein
VTRPTTHPACRAGIAGVDKNVLHQNKAVGFGFRLATEADWDSFREFWIEERESPK